MKSVLLYFILNKFNFIFTEMCKMPWSFHQDIKGQGSSRNRRGKKIKRKKDIDPISQAAAGT